MKIKKMHILNVLSYEDETIEFNKDLNIFVGSNGSGKSNLINIIIYIMKRYCFKNFEFSSMHGMEMTKFQKYSIREKNPLYNSTEDFFLRKHKLKENDNSLIDVTVLFEEQDAKDLQEIKKYQSQICYFLDNQIDGVSFIDDRYQIPINEVKKIFDLNAEDLYIENNIEIRLREVGNSWKIENNGEKYYDYMKYFSLIYNIMGQINIVHELKNPFVFFEAYRNNASETTMISISESNNQNIVNLQSWQSISSMAYSIGISSTYIMLATRKFGEIMRNCIEKKDGLNVFYNLPEYKRLQSFFIKFEYEICLKCINTNNNVYQFYIKKGDLEIEIDTISSGEREIINFIFGLFLEKIRDGIVIIDEPELHLHPSWQKKLIQILKQETENQNIQLFFVTHSSSFITYNVLNNIFRIYKENDFSKIVPIKDLLEGESGEDVRKKLNMINSTNNEKIFFSKSVVLVEGITDEILFKEIYVREFKQIEEGLEFININGKSNFKNFSTILSKLKIQYFFIGDYDNVQDYQELFDCFEVNQKSQVNDLKQKSKSYSCIGLIDSIANYLNESSENNKENLSLNYEWFCKHHLSHKKQEILNERAKILQFINKKYSENCYFLTKGEIEDYLDSGTKKKAVNFEKVISIITNDNEYQKFSQTKDFDELRRIIHDIHHKVILI